MASTAGGGDRPGLRRVRAADEVPARQVRERGHRDVRRLAHSTPSPTRTETFFTVAAWTDGTESLLPRADYESALGEDDEMFLLPFDDAIEEELELAPEPILYPARYRVGSWPDAPVMDRLRSRAANP